MARYTITHRCGHEQTHQLYGKHSDRDRKLDWLATQDCSDCARMARSCEPAKVLARVVPEVTRLGLHAAAAAAARRADGLERDYRRDLTELANTHAEVARAVDSGSGVVSTPAAHRAIASRKRWRDAVEGVRHAQHQADTAEPRPAQVEVACYQGGDDFADELTQRGWTRSDHTPCLPRSGVMMDLLEPSTCRGWVYVTADIERGLAEALWARDMGWTVTGHDELATAWRSLGEGRPDLLPTPSASIRHPDAGDRARLLKDARLAMQSMAVAMEGVDASRNEAAVDNLAWWAAQVLAAVEVYRTNPDKPTPVEQELAAAEAEERRREWAAEYERREAERWVEIDGRRVHTLPVEYVGRLDTLGYHHSHDGGRFLVGELRSLTGWLGRDQLDKYGLHRSYAVKIDGEYVLFDGRVWEADKGPDGAWHWQSADGADLIILNA